MKYLIKKDFISASLFITGMSLAIPFITILTIWTMVDHFGGIIIGVFTLIVVAESIFPSLMFILIDSTTGTDKTFASLPIKRKTIVLSRYTGSIIVLTYNFLLVILTCLAAIYFFDVRDSILVKLVSLNGIYIMFFFLIFITSFVLPFIFKSGAGGGLIKATIALIILLSLFPAGDFVINQFKDYLSIDPEFLIKLAEDILFWIKDQPAYFIKLGSVWSLLLILIVSYLLSVNFYNKMDIE